MEKTGLKITNQEAHARFIALARKISLDPDNKWVGGYAEYEWDHSRHIFEAAGVLLSGSEVLEVGCNFGATSLVLAAMGARVTAIDVDPDFVDLARVNAERYGLQNNISFLHMADTTALPMQDGTFDVVACNSVLEYIPHQLLGAVQREIDRVLKSTGLVFVMGTSSRAWPREVHSRRWWVNYLPRSFDPLLFKKSTPVRGVSPLQVCFGFGRYENLDLTDKGHAFLLARRRMGISWSKYLLLKSLNLICPSIGISVGLLIPNMSVTLKKLTAGQ